MALARIITRSQACSRELALDLLARGYAVEIVSPDKIPDSLADLELRVDAETNPDQLIATVETQDGASLDFVHHLKAPMGDFVRRQPEPEFFPANDSTNDEPVSFNAEPTLEDVEHPAESPQLFAKIISPSAAVLYEPHQEDEAAHLIASEAIDPPSHFATEEATVPGPMLADPATVDPIIFETMPLELSPTESASAPATSLPVQHLDRTPSSPWRAALILAAVVLLALALAVGARRNGKVAIETPALPPTAEKVLAASPPTKSQPDPNPPQESSLPKPDPAIAETPTAPKAQAVAANVAAPAARREEVVAPDTVTYLDNHYKPATKSKSTKRQARSHSKPHKRDSGIIAANSVTYLNKSAPKPAK
jgi:hypothetical protein